MGELRPLVSPTLAAYYEEVREQVHKWVDPLSTDDIWSKPYSYGNSIGHLVLHMTGNLNHYIGKNVAGTGYVRNRPLEFSDPSKLPKQQVLANFDRTIDMVAATIRAQSADDFLSLPIRPSRAQTLVLQSFCAWPLTPTITSARSSTSPRNFLALKRLARSG